MSSTKGPIIYKAPGKEVPEAYFKKVMAAYPNGGGLACIGNNLIDIVSANTPSPIDHIMKIQAEQKDSHLIFWFCKTEDGKEPHDDNLQPFKLIEEEVEGEDADKKKIVWPEPVLIGFTDGDFLDYHHAGSTLSNDFHMVQGYLYPKVNKLWSLVNGDMDKFVSLLKDSDFQRDMLNQSKIRGTIVLATCTGEVFSYPKNDKGAGFDGWWTTEVLDYKEESYPVQTELQTAPPMTMAQRAALIRGRRTATPPDPQPEVVVDRPPALVEHLQSRQTQAETLASVKNAQEAMGKTVLISIPKNLKKEGKKTFCKLVLNSNAPPAGYNGDNPPDLEVPLKRLQMLEQQGKLKMYDGLAALLRSSTAVPATVPNSLIETTEKTPLVAQGRGDTMVIATSEKGKTAVKAIGHNVLTAEDADAMGANYNAPGATAWEDPVLGDRSSIIPQEQVYALNLYLKERKTPNAVGRSGSAVAGDPADFTEVKAKSFCDQTGLKQDEVNGLSYVDLTQIAVRAPRAVSRLIIDQKNIINGLTKALAEMTRDMDSLTQPEKPGVAQATVVDDTPPLQATPPRRNRLAM